ncbi:hypothetical protein AVEN_39081-1 [Araneus ventricosus]|uniref:Uncharacterized protein n=1 Tax=Araneus ventricosus TaxID=182803 RepID=A0A4Y2DH37_ARAVE|nr:hypothetical protein AVEN_39081-1 [Araneus ventricosus]
MKRDESKSLFVFITFWSPLQCRRDEIFTVKCELRLLIRLEVEWMDETNICVVDEYIHRELDSPPRQSQNQFLGRCTHSLLHRCTSPLHHNTTSDSSQLVFYCLILPKQLDIAL